jgi:hypothetical protein
MKVVLIFIMIFVFSSPLFAIRQHPEKWYQKKWCEEQKGKVEVVLPDGTRCDCVTATHAIEFDFGLPDSCTSWRFSYARHLRVMMYFCYFKSLITKGAESAARRVMETSSSPSG